MRTTLDLDLQAAVTQALHEVLPHSTDPQAAVVAIDYRTGDVKAMATLRRVPAVAASTGKVVVQPVQGYLPKLGFNLATAALRSTGSTIKPFTLAQALLQGQGLETSRYAPSCLLLPNRGGAPDPYRVCNADPVEVGTYTLRRALADSVNTVYVPLAEEVGRAKVAALARRAGLAGSIDPTNLSFGAGGGSRSNRSRRPPRTGRSPTAGSTANRGPSPRSAPGRRGPALARSTSAPQPAHPSGSSRPPWPTGSSRP